ncbi:MAG: hypothetical protein Q9217_000702 [Psora testacea]
MKEYAFSEPDNGDVDQGWALVAATTIIGAALITCEVIVGGLGRHQYYLTFAQKKNSRALGWADWIQTFITLMFTKISICLFLLRIVDARRFKVALHGLIWFLVLFTSVCVFLFIGVCRPLKAYWNIKIQNAVCLSELQVKEIALAQGILSIITDLICAAFPVFFLRNLQVKLRTKIALCLLMGLGVITAVCCTVRTALSGAMTDPDITWAITTNVAWRLPEVNIGIVCANAPILRPLYLFFRGKLDTSKGARIYNSASKDRFVMHNNMQWAGNSAMVQPCEMESGWQKGSKVSADESVNLEMGMPIYAQGGVRGKKAG